MADVDQARPGWGKAPAVVAGAVAGWLLCAAVAPISRDASHLGRMELALAGVGFVGAWVWLHRAQAARWMWQTWRASLALICVGLCRRVARCGPPEDTESLQVRRKQEGRGHLHV